MSGTGRSLTPPRAAAVAGVVFSVLMGISLAIIRLAVPTFESDTGAWLSDPTRTGAVHHAIQLVPFAGVAFLWFIGVLRNRLGDLEDKFFATVFLGSGLLFVASLFAAAAFAGSLLETQVHSQNPQLNGDVYYLARVLIRSFLNVFAIKMAGVFTFSTSMVVFRTHILPRWVAFAGFASAIVLLLVITSWPWIALIFPLWMLLISTTILVSDFRRA